MAIDVRAADREELQRAATLELARRFFLPFVKLTFPEYHVGRVQRFLARKVQGFVQAVERGEEPRLIVLLPPRSGKSELVSRRLPPWVLGRNPDWPLILVSYGADLAEDLSGDARAVMQSEEYQEVFGLQSAVDPRDAVELEKGRKALSRWQIQGRRGGLRAVGMGGAITGRGAKVLIIDDYLKNREQADSETEREKQWEWYRSTARTRVEPGGGILVTATHWHWDDLVGRLLRLQREDPLADQWEVVVLSALAENEHPLRAGPDPLGRQEGEPLDPARFDTPALLRIRASVGSREWAALYQQRPTDEEGAIFKRAWWRFEDLARANPRVVYQFWDLAFSRREEADYSVCTTWGVEPGPVFRLLDVYRQRLTFPEAGLAARRLWEQYRPRAVVVEKKNRTDEEFDSFKLKSRIPNLLWFHPPPGMDKVRRAHAVTPLIEAGSVILPASAPWLEDYLQELGQFDKGVYDDQVDSTTMALICLGVEGIRVRGTVSLRDFRMVQ